jgi:hypothetical protein
MAMTRTAFAAFLKPDLYRVYIETGKERPPEFTQFFNVDDMPWNPVTDRQVSGLGTLVAMPEGEQFSLDQAIVGGTKDYEAVPFGLAVEITYPMWKDDQYGVMREMVAELARSSRFKMEIEAWSVLNSAFDTSVTGFTAGESLCSTAHVGLDGAARANRPSPDVGFSVLAVQNSLVRYENMTNERGLPRLLAPTMALLAPENRFLVREVLGSVGKPFTADNEQNSLLQDDLRWMIVHYFTLSKQWFICASKGIHDLNFFFRDRPIFDVFDDPWSKNAIATVYQRHTKGFGSWRGVDGSNGG